MDRIPGREAQRQLGLRDDAVVGQEMAAIDAGRGGKFFRPRIAHEAQELRLYDDAGAATRHRALRTLMNLNVAAGRTQSEPGAEASNRSARHENIEHVVRLRKPRLLGRRSAGQ